MEKKSFSATAGSGAVKLTVNGKKKSQKLNFPEKFLIPEI